MFKLVPDGEKIYDTLCNECNKRLNVLELQKELLKRIGKKFHISFLNRLLHGGQEISLKEISIIVNSFSNISADNIRDYIKVEFVKIDSKYDAILSKNELNQLTKEDVLHFIRENDPVSTKHLYDYIEKLQSVKFIGKNKIYFIVKNLIDNGIIKTNGKKRDCLLSFNEFSD